MPSVALRVRVCGRVQGVFFRAWTEQQARQLGVRGWVRNAADGSVEGHLEGEQAAVEQLIELLHRGPPSAQVTEVITEAAESTESGSFDVRP